MRQAAATPPPILLTSSQVSSYGAGLYATWLNSTGVYVDGAVKYNHFSNELRTGVP
ncbi:autotransporter outer membrane beta-barrel domain-containing protein [Enterobacter asburiae]|uniref:autotransporter outer membrane beta-barrel domain-containing protein n=1 Tax=Enterobacter asburiae TaxID=61645 RepID=UPI003A100812